MHELDERREVAGRAGVVVKLATAAAGAVVVAAIVAVVWLRIANGGAEPAGQNWWLVTWLVIGLSTALAGTAQLSCRGSRLLGAAFVAVAVGATATAVSTQYAGYLEVHHDDSMWTWLADVMDWSKPLAAGALAALVPLLVRPPGRHRTLVHAVCALTVVAIATLAAATALDGPARLRTVAAWTIVAAATIGVARLASSWQRGRADPDDPLPAWLLAGSVAAWVAFVPMLVHVGEWTYVGRHVVSAMIALATVPLLVGGAVVETIRERASPLLGVSHRVLEWAVLASGVIALYTGVVAGLGRLVGGSGPTWLLVATTGTIALLLEPARDRVRRLVDRLVYGARDDTLAVVQRIVEQLGADAGDDLLGALVENLQRELRLDAVAIDLRVDSTWQPAAAIGSASTRCLVVPLRHHGALVGRLVVGWDTGPFLRERDEEVLAQLAGPLSLAVGWVRLADDLRRSSVAVVSAREEERRRLRRDLHDGLGPTLTGVSLGLRTAMRQLARSPEHEPGAQVLLGRVADEVDGTVGDLKRIVRDLRPTALDQLGLLGAVTEFARTIGDAVEMHLTLPSQPVELPAAVEVATYRIVTEAVTNVVRHAGAARCWLSIATGPAVLIDVVDDGIGIVAGRPPGVGLTAMQERAAELGGSVRLSDNVPRGTCVHVRLPAALP